MTSAARGSDKPRTLLSLRIRNLIAAREFNTATANRELQGGDGWLYDHGQCDRELANEIDELFSLMANDEAMRLNAWLDDIQDALIECESYDDGDAYPESKLITLGDVWAVLETYRPKKGGRGDEN